MAGGTPSVERLPAVWGLSILVYLAFLLVPIVHFTLFRTKPGLRILASGEHPGRPRASASTSAGTATPA